jgi:NADH:ubiquinone oxidoreductase subunit 3 (subunit A)
MLFIVMDLFTLLIYPFVFLYGKLDQFLKARNVLVTGPVTPGR